MKKITPTNVLLVVVVTLQLSLTLGSILKQSVMWAVVVSTRNQAESVSEPDAGNTEPQTVYVDVPGDYADHTDEDCQVWIRKAYYLDDMGVGFELGGEPDYILGEFDANWFDEDYQVILEPGQTITVVICHDEVLAVLPE